MKTLVVNLSLRSIRVIIFEDDGEKKHEDWLPIRTSINGAWVEQDPNEWWSLLLELLNKVFSHTKYGKEIGFITITSSALCLVCLDKKGNVLDNSFMVSDKRANKEAKDLKEHFTDFFEQNKSFKCEPGYFLPKILWLKNNKTEKFKKTYKFLSANDFFVFKFTKKFITDTLNAEKFYFDSSKNQYSRNLLKFTGISEKKLPSVVKPGTRIGKINKDFKQKLGIKQDIEVIISTYDAICALIGSSTYKDGELNNVCGTCSSYRFFTRKDPYISNSPLLVQKIDNEKLSIIGASNNLEGGVLEWAKECFYGDNLKDDNFLYNLMQTEALESALGANGIIFLPYLLGERVPFLDPDVRGIFFGIERFHTRKDIVKSVFEAVAFQAKLVLEEFHKIGFEISSINMSGGVSKMPFAVQLRTDILGIPINTLNEVETTALGAFILSQKARAKIKSIKDASSFIQIKQTFIPNMHNHNCYSSIFILYRELYTDHKEMFKKRKKTLEKISHYRRQVLANL